jgi:hypothetical protein
MRNSIKLHLGRLEEMEYLLAHRGRRGQSFVYEPIYDGQGKDGQPFLIGLIDVERLKQSPGGASSEYNSNEAWSGVEAKKSGFEAENSASGRGQVGPESGGSRDEPKPISPNNERGSDTIDENGPGKTRIGNLASQT